MTQIGDGWNIFFFSVLIVVNKAKGWISKRVFQEKQCTPHFPKKEHFLPPWYAHVRKVRFSENLTCFVFLETPVLSFVFYPYSRQYITDNILPTIFCWQINKNFTICNLEFLAHYWHSCSHFKVLMLRLTYCIL